MATFAIIAPAENEALRAAVVTRFAGDFFEIAPGQFVVVAKDLTSQQVAERLGAKGEVGQFVVFTSAGHFGWHRKDLWEWLAVRAGT